MSDLATGDLDGPLPCSCYRIEVWDFGHDPTKCADRPPLPTTLRTAYVLEHWCPGSGDWEWAAEWADIVQADCGMSLAGLIGDIAVNGIKEPLLLGDDGRVWDGHHRLMVARLLGIQEIAVEYGHGGQRRRR
jgi:hypothetical protein